MLARLQQFIVIAVVIGFAFSMAWGWAHIVAAVELVILVYASFMALEFVAAAAQNQAITEPKATLKTFVAAWWLEATTAPTVFCWRQPFFSNDEADYLPKAIAQTEACAQQRTRGVVLVHGFFCNRGFWTPWMRRLRARGTPFVAVNLEPIFGSIDNYATLIEAAVNRVRDATGCAPVIVCHSMGGLAARAWLRQCRAEPADCQALHIVTIATPHHGTWLARFGHTTNVAQMRLDGEWIKTLEQDERALMERAATIAPSKSPSMHGKVKAIPFTCWYSNCDNIVMPARNATLSGADNRLLSGLAHVSMAFDPRIFNFCIALLDAPVTE